MDIPRPPARGGRKRLLYGALALAAIVLAALGLHGLKPAAPRVERAAYLDAKRNAEAAESLAVKELIAANEASRARDHVEELATRFKVEQERLTVMTEAADSQLSLQQAQVDRLRDVNQFQRGRVRSMVVLAGAAGTLQELPLEVGQWAQSGATLARIVEPGRLKAVLRIPETQAKDVTIGQPAAIDTRNGIAHGKVARIDPGAGRWEARGTTFRQDGLPHQLLVLSDLSRVLRAEERSAWQRLVRVLGHEINNSLAPIKSIAGSLRSLAERAARPRDWEQDLRSGLQVIEGRSESLARFMGAYAQLARLPQPRLAPVEVRVWVRRVAALETRLDVKVTEGPAVAVTADGDQLDQLLINLVRNAADAALETAGGVCVGWRVLAGVVEVTADDEGPGLPDPGNLFVPFFTTKASGTGIGLVLSRQIAEAHGGTVVLEPRPNVWGARACLRLPLGPLMSTADS